MTLSSCFSHKMDAKTKNNNVSRIDDVCFIFKKNAYLISPVETNNFI